MPKIEKDNLRKHLMRLDKWSLGRIARKLQARKLQTKKELVDTVLLYSAEEIQESYSIMMHKPLTFKGEITW